MDGVAVSKRSVTVKRVHGGGGTSSVCEFLTFGSAGAAAVWGTVEVQRGEAGYAFVIGCRRREQYSGRGTMVEIRTASAGTRGELSGWGVGSIRSRGSGSTQEWALGVEQLLLLTMPGLKMT